MSLHTSLQPSLATYIDNLDEDAWYYFMSTFGMELYEHDLSFFKARIVQRVKREVGVTVTTGEALVERTWALLQELGMIRPQRT